MTNDLHKLTLFSALALCLDRVNVNPDDFLTEDQVDAFTGFLANIPYTEAEFTLALKSLYAQSIKEVFE